MLYRSPQSLHWSLEVISEAKKYLYYVYLLLIPCEEPWHTLRRHACQNYKGKQPLHLSMQKNNKQLPANAIFFNCHKLTRPAEREQCKLKGIVMGSSYHEASLRSECKQARVIKAEPCSQVKCREQETNVESLQYVSIEDTDHMIVSNPSSTEMQNSQTQCVLLIVDPDMVEYNIPYRWLARKPIPGPIIYRESKSSVEKS